MIIEIEDGDSASTRRRPKRTVSDTTQRYVHWSKLVASYDNNNIDIFSTKVLKFVIVFCFVLIYSLFLKT